MERGRAGAAGAAGAVSELTGPSLSPARAVVAMLGFAGQAISTKTGPLANLFEHVADPTNVNLLNNSVAVPL